jgi:hypothetical protein
MSITAIWDVTSRKARRRNEMTVTSAGNLEIEFDSPAAFSAT